MIKNYSSFYEMNRSEEESDCSAKDITVNVECNAKLRHEKLLCTLIILLDKPDAIFLKKFES